ncbi:MAG: biotin transporter BioY, partial [Clostridia bacterium]|nr:biotin transporter BioY [Clostridia bacterium]
TAWFMVTKGTDLMTSLSLCVLPFLPFDAVKILLAAFLSLRLEKPLQKAQAAFGQHRR